MRRREFMFGLIAQLQGKDPAHRIGDLKADTIAFTAATIPVFTHLQQHRCNGAMVTSS